LTKKGTFEKSTVIDLLNDELSEDLPHTTPLFYTYPNVELYDQFVKFGADPKKLSLLHSYFNFRKQTHPNNQSQLFDFITAMVKKGALDPNELDGQGRNLIALVYSDLRDDLSSTKIDSKLDLSELKFLK